MEDPLATRLEQVQDGLAKSYDESIERERPEPTEDAGAATFAYYRFQHALTAYACLSLLDDDTVLAVVCELHEDYIIVRRDEDELVSVKHREAARDRWTPTSICKDGGLRHLFLRWQAFGECVRVRLQTNAALADDALVLTSMRADNEYDTAVRVFAPKLGADPDSAERFLRALQIDAELPRRDDLLYRLVGKDISQNHPGLGWREHEVREKFTAVQHLVDQAAAADLRSSLRTVERERDPSLAMRRAIEAKTITPSRMRDALSRVVDLVDDSSPPLDTKKLNEFLKTHRAGGLDDTPKASSAGLKLSGTSRPKQRSNHVEITNAGSVPIHRVWAFVDASLGSTSPPDTFISRSAAHSIAVGGTTQFADVPDAFTFGDADFGCMFVALDAMWLWVAPPASKASGAWPHVLLGRFYSLGAVR